MIKVTARSAFICFYFKNALSFDLIYLHTVKYKIHWLLGHLSNSCDLLQWVGVPLHAVYDVCRALTFSSQELLGQS